MTLNLPNDIEAFVEDQVNSRQYPSAQEVIFAGLRLLKMRASAGAKDDFQPGELVRLLAVTENDDGISLDDAIARRRAERARAKAGE